MNKLTKPKNMKIQIIKRLVRKAFVVIFILFSFIIIFVGKPDSMIISKTSGVVMNLVAPVIGAISYPIRKIGAFVADAQHFGEVDAINKKLEREISELREQIAALKSDRAEAVKIKETCNFSSNEAVRFVLGTRVVGASGGGFSRSFILD
ncbi:MAG: hypothetical protein LBL52_03020, partial [Rickettsiales bacterium]|nr:hypothetical protein [Rickettsiales bacterium]